MTLRIRLLKYKTDSGLSMEIKDASIKGALSILTASLSADELKTVIADLQVELDRKGAK